MASYAAVVLAMQKIERLEHSFEPNIFPHIAQILFPIREELCYLEPLLERFTFLRSTNLRVDPIEEKIERVIWKLDDLIELCMRIDTIPNQSLSSSNPILVEELGQVKREVRSFIEDLKSRRQYGHQEEICFPEDFDVSSRVISLDDEDIKTKTKMVGLDNELQKVVKWAIEGSLEIEIMSVAGMAGIGKTTLMQQVFNHPDIRRHFSKLIMVRIGPKYHLKEILLFVLNHMNPMNQEKIFDDSELRKNLERFLSAERYLIVLDDVWSRQVWNELHTFICDYKNGSRIILTTRSLSVAREASSLKNLHQKRFLNDDESWKLLREIVFPGGVGMASCSYQLESIGMEIANNCEGLPLALVSVGKLLRENEKTVEYWTKVSEDENPLRIGEDTTTTISKSLYLSCWMVPQYLKACFFYMGVLPKHCEITIRKIGRLFMAEGFLVGKRSITSYDDAEEHLHELVAESVALEKEWIFESVKAKVYRIHVVFRNLCISEARKEKFCHVIKKYAHCSSQDMDQQQRLCLHNNAIFGLKEIHGLMASVSSPRSLLCFGPQHQYPVQVYFSFKFLKVLNALRIRLYQFPYSVLELVWLHYLAITYDGELPKSISKLIYLEFFILVRYHNIKTPFAPVYLPWEIWQLNFLRHLKCMGADLLDPLTIIDESEDDIILTSLMAISGVSASSCKSNILARVPNLTKLGICIDLAHDEVETFNFNFFDDVAQNCPQLESFRCVITGLISHTPSVTSLPPVFPDYLMKLTLSGCGFPWEYIRVLGRLRKLQILKLKCYSFQGSEWETCDGEFPSLRYLLLEDLDLQEWRVGRGQFPELGLLIVRHCYKLQKIPQEIGDVKILEKIVVDDCSASLVTSAEELEGSNQNLQVYINSSWDDSKNRTSTS